MSLGFSSHSLFVMCIIITIANENPKYQALLELNEDLTIRLQNAEKELQYIFRIDVREILVTSEFKFTDMSI